MIIIAVIIILIPLIIWSIRRIYSVVDYTKIIYEDGNEYYFRIIKRDSIDYPFKIKVYTKKSMFHIIDDYGILNKINNRNVTNKLNCILQKYVSNKKETNIEDFDMFIGNVTEDVKMKYKRNEKLDKLGIK